MRDGKDTRAEAFDLARRSLAVWVGHAMAQRLTYVGRQRHVAEWAEALAALAVACEGDPLDMTTRQLVEAGLACDLFPCFGFIPLPEADEYAACETCDHASV